MQDESGAKSLKNVPPHSARTIQAHLEVSGNPDGYVVGRYLCNTGWWRVFCTFINLLHEGIAEGKGFSGNVCLYYTLCVETIPLFIMRKGKLFESKGSFQSRLHLHNLV